MKTELEKLDFSSGQLAWKLKHIVVLFSLTAVADPSAHVGHMPAQPCQSGNNTALRPVPTRPIWE